MIKINLLPPGERPSPWPLMRILSVAALFILVQLSIIYLFSLYHLYSLEKKLEEVQNQYTLLQPTEDNMMMANSKQDKINIKNAILGSLTKERKSWYAIMSHLGAATPKHIWLREIHFTDKNAVQMKGTALTYPDIADYIHRLESDTFFAEPRLITADNNAGQSTASFEIQLKLKGLQM